VFDLLGLEGVKAIGKRQENGSVIVVSNSILPDPKKCPSCGHEPIYKHGSRCYQYADTPIYGNPVKIEISRQRYRCKACKTVITPDIPSLDDKRIATKRLIAHIRSKSLNRTFTSMSEETGLVLNTVKAIAVDHIRWLDENHNRETPRIMGVDEVMISGNYRAVICNLEMRTVFDVYEKRTKPHITEFFRTLKNKENVEWIALDMWGPYKVVLNKELPDARLVIDRFHVVAKATEALESLRIKLQSDMEKSDRIKMKKHLRWALLRRNENRTDEDNEKLDYIRKNHPEIALAYDLGEQFHDIYTCKTRSEAESAFEIWTQSIPTEFMGSYGEVAAMVNRHYEDIFSYFDFPITNGYTEAMNGVMKTSNRMGRGYSFEVIRGRLLYSKIAAQSGSIITHSGKPKSVVDPVSTWGDMKAVHYGCNLSTLDCDWDD